MPKGTIKEARTMGSQTSTFTTDLGAMLAVVAHQRRIGKYCNRKKFIIQDMGEDGAVAAGRQPTDDLQCLQTQINSMKRDMDALGRSCSAEAVAGFTISDSSRPQPGRVRSANSQATPIRLTVSPEVPAKQRPTSPLAFLAVPRPVASPHHKKYKANGPQAPPVPSGAAGHEGLHVVRYWRMLPPPHRI